MRRRWIPITACMAFVACAESTGEDTASKATRRSREPRDLDTPSPTYHAQVRPLLERHCLQCHVEGGIGPVPLDDYERVSRVQTLVVGAVASGAMPPWPASADCHELRDVRRLSDAERSMLEAWQEAGFPEGDEDDYTKPEVAASLAPAADPNRVVMPAESYLPDPAITDEYRCFITEDRFDQDTYVTAMDIRPGVRAQVHHVQVHKISVNQLDAVAALDAAAEGPGYPCAGGAGSAITSVNMFSWRPGSAAVVFEPGDAALIEAGSAFVLQVHYNNQFLPEGGPVPDRSGVALWTLPAEEQPRNVVTRRGIYGPVGPPPADGSTFGVIPAGEREVVGETTQPMSQLSTVAGTYVQGEIIGMTPHMHTLGTRLSATLGRADGGDCMIDVPEWDFEWQLDYSFAEPVAYEPQDALTVRCEYDNSSEHQPIVDGVRQVPRDVTWGEGSLDEMCLNYVWLRFEREAFAAAAGR